MPVVANLRCCGIGELHGLDELVNPFAIKVTTQTIAELTRKGEGNDRMNGYGRSSGYLIATTSPRQRHLHPAMRKLGFVVLDTFRNPRTQRTLTLWGKALQGRGKKAARRPRAG